MTTLKDVVYILRSKNAGPFQITFDMIFQSPDLYESVRAQKVITKERIAAIYKTEQETVQIFEYDQALAIKVTIPRTYPSGSLYDTDVFGAQQHVPLMNMEIQDIREG